MTALYNTFLAPLVEISVAASLYRIGLAALAGWALGWTVMGAVIGG